MKLKVQPAATQKEVTKFYDSLIFPSRVSHSEYARLIPSSSQGTIGDFGCGQSLFYERLKGHCPEPTFLDISMNALHTIDYGLRINADICALPVRSQVYDLIACIGVIHHLPNMQPAFEEISRVLKKKGLAIIGVYSQVSLQARLRRIYDRLNSEWAKKTLFYLAGLFIWLKNWRNGHNAMRIEREKRAQDLLQTPLVWYTSLDHYIQMAKEVDLKLIDDTQISSMAILKLVRT